IAAQTGTSGNVSVANFGSVSVTNNGAGAAYGVYATNSGNGTLNVTANGNITANNAAGAGILAIGGNSAGTITNNFIIRSTGTVNSPSIGTGSTGGTITLTNNGIIQSTGNNVADDLVLGVVPGSGAITINNPGRIIGRIDVSGASASTFNNT